MPSLVHFFVVFSDCIGANITTPAYVGRRRKRDGLWAKNYDWEIMTPANEGGEEADDYFVNGDDDTYDYDNILKLNDLDSSSSLQILAREKRAVGCNATCACALCLADFKGCLHTDHEFGELELSDCSLPKRGLCSAPSKSRVYAGGKDAHCKYIHFISFMFVQFTKKTHTVAAALACELHKVLLPKTG